MTMSALIPALFGVVGLVAAYYIYKKIKEYPEGEAAVVEIGEQIHLGAMVFMRREYKMLSIFALVLMIALWITLGFATTFSFLMGALASAAAGYIGMNTATRANVRTTTAAHTRGAAEALSVAFYGGSVMGLAVASLGLLGWEPSISSSEGIQRQLMPFTVLAWGRLVLRFFRVSAEEFTPRALILERI